MVRLKADTTFIRSVRLQPDPRLVRSVRLPASDWFQRSYGEAWP